MGGSSDDVYAELAGLCFAKWILSGNDAEEDDLIHARGYLDIGGVSGYLNPRYHVTACTRFSPPTLNVESTAAWDV